MEPFQPELGQLVFDDRYFDLQCPEYVVALLRAIGEEVERVESNRLGVRFPSPCDNSGSEYANETFSMRAYYWGDCECDPDGDGHFPDCPAIQPNFRCGDVAVSWYKYLGRGTTINRAITEAEAVALFDRCVASVRVIDVDPWEEDRTDE